MPHTSKQNERAKRKHHHLIETTITLLLQCCLTTKFWLEALTADMYLTNRLPHTSLQFQIPFTLLFKTQPNFQLLKPFGCLCFPWLEPYAAHKLIPKSSPCVFLGYCDHTKGYKCYDLVTTKVSISRHVRFVKNEFPYPHMTGNTSFVNSPSESLYFFVPLISFFDIVLPLAVPPLNFSSS